MNYDWLDVAKRLQGLAQTGLEYGKDKYDLERYEELRNISIEIVSKFAGIEMDEARELFANEKGYQTPKVDVRGVVFKDEKILMVREKIDGRWSLPGGWADVGYSPGEIAAKEIFEEAGLIVKPVKLLGVLDKSKYNKSPYPYHVYKIFILCEITGGEMKPGFETSDVGFFERDNLPELSIGRNTEEQIKMMFDFLDNPNREPVFD